MSRLLPIQLILVAVCCVFDAHSEDLSEEQLKEIVAKPHSPKLTVEALKIFPPGRFFLLVREYSNPSGGGKSKLWGQWEQKWVDGKYIVSNEEYGGFAQKGQRILFYDEKSERYVQYFLTAKQIVFRAEGIRIDDSRAIVWKQKFVDPQYGVYDTLSTYSNTNGATVWHSIYRQNCVPYYLEDGVATATKMDFEISAIETKDAAALKSELRLAVTVGKADEYTKSKFAVYRDGKKLRTLTPEKVENEKLIFSVDDSKAPENTIQKTDCIFLDE